MKQLLTLALFFSLLFTSGLAIAQVGIGTITPDVNAQLDIASEDKGLLIPRVTEAARVGMGAAANGLLVYQMDVVTGFYFRQNDTWVRLNTSGSAIIPFASGTPISMTTTTFGVTALPAFVGFGSSSQALALLDANINLGSGSANYAFSVPRAGVIESLSAYFTTTNFTPLTFGNALTLTAQLYSSNAPNNTFTAVPGAVVNLAVTGSTPFGPVEIGRVFFGAVTGLSIPVALNKRLLMVYSFKETAQGPPAGIIFGNTLTGQASGGVSIAGQ